MFVAGNALTEAIKDITRAGAADLAVAFWGKDACERLTLPNDLTRLRVACDAYSGACHPMTFRRMLDRGAKVVNVSRLHAKVYIGPSRMIISSANASANGLAEEGRELDSRLEAGYVTEDASDLLRARHWFNIFSQGEPIEINNLKDIKMASDHARAQPHRLQPKDTLLGKIRTQPYWFSGRNIYVMAWSIEEADFVNEEEASSYRSSPFFDETLRNSSTEKGYYPFYSTAKPKLKINDIVIEFMINLEKVSCTGAWRVQGLVGRFPNGQIIPCDSSARPLGLAFNRQDQAKLTRAAQAMISSGSFRTGDFIPLREIAEVFAAEITDK